jgi:Flp pilus assembly protein TadB
MNLFVVLLLVVLVVLTVIAVIAEVYCSMAERRRSEGLVKSVKENQTIKVQGPSPTKGSVGTVRKIA